MSTRSAEYLEAIDHLPSGATLVFSQVSWEDYENVLDDLGHRPGLRVAYDEGTLEIMTVSSEHEDYAEFILRLAGVLSEELDIQLETRGSTTWKREKLQKGLEPDTCFYIANAQRIIGKRKIDLESDPPPDVAVEVEVTKESLSKFPIYAALGVPEIWRYDGTRLQMYQLTDDLLYVEIAESRFFPGLTGSILADSIELSKTKGQTDALKAFRQQIRAGKS
jgi:Uma2 family endonuclease